MAQDLFSVTELQVIEDEPRIQDLRLAEALGFSQPRQIRELIKRNVDELKSYGSLSHDTTTPIGGGPAATEYWLTDEQALIICMRSDASNAQQVRREITRVFMEWRRGNLAPATAAALTLRSLRDVVREEVVPIRTAVDEIRGNVVVLRQEQSLLRTRIDDIVPRRDFSKEARAQFRYVCQQRYQGNCPSCWKIRIICDDGSADLSAQYDHFNGRERNKPEDGWIVCQECNLKLRKQDFHISRIERFRVFQQYRVELTNPLRKKGTTVDEQASLFFEDEL